MIQKDKIGEYLERYLEDNKVSVQAFAVKIGVSPSSVYNWLAGKTLPLPLYYEQFSDLLSPYEKSPIIADFPAQKP